MTYNQNKSILMCAFNIFFLVLANLVLAEAKTVHSYLLIESASEKHFYEEGKTLKLTLVPSTYLIGNWRGEFSIKSGIEIPFNFIIREEGAILKAFLVNGEERFPTGDIRIEQDSVIIPFPLFENELAFKLVDGQLKGELRRQDLKGSATPVIAKKGMIHRFNEASSSPVTDISGTYDVVFQNNSGKEEKAVGVFKQANGIVTATFLRITGDSRFLEGIIEDNVIRLSSFIGSSPSMYIGKVDLNGIIQGENISARSTTTFIAKRNADATLPDAYSLTRLKEGSDRLVFNFKDSEGKIIGSNDYKFKDKPYIIAIGGTWCPNCMDEAAFLGKWYKENRNRGIEIVGIQFERQEDSAYVKKVFNRFRKYYGIEYSLLLGGLADKQAVVEALPQLENFISFPTTVFVDKHGKVKKIHTGFSGPATGKHYTKFINDFNAEVDELLK
ncbi:TlpA disulfide reductase family protein [Sediminibacterium sp. TEGAF015]|uniref:TlpA disulfide reductase family protein n=1 Tax=Sediminibacterium sp. TEGAF015 TaxID=575378 RepID=UPI0022026F2C|nr:TlpA disulfide reductase family protein [Sediminibacterium sp. TEGAF015]BDQ12441.1 hypothetical protein TEGAF0_16580 [Sediminibacterium sp. TEGAF015]